MPCSRWTSTRNRTRPRQSTRKNSSARTKRGGSSPPRQKPRTRHPGFRLPPEHHWNKSVALFTKQGQPPPTTHHPFLSQAAEHDEWKGPARRQVPISECGGRGTERPGTSWTPDGRPAAPPPTRGTQRAAHARGTHHKATSARVARRGALTTGHSTGGTSMDLQARGHRYDLHTAVTRLSSSNDLQSRALPRGQIQRLGRPGDLHTGGKKHNHNLLRRAAGKPKMTVSFRYGQPARPQLANGASRGARIHDRGTALPSIRPPSGLDDGRMPGLAPPQDDDRRELSRTVAVATVANSERAGDSDAAISDGSGGAGATRQELFLIFIRTGGTGGAKAGRSRRKVGALEYQAFQIVELARRLPSLKPYAGNGRAAHMRRSASRHRTGRPP